MNQYLAFRLLRKALETSEIAGIRMAKVIRFSNLILYICSSWFAGSGRVSNCDTWLVSQVGQNVCINSVLGFICEVRQFCKPWRGEKERGQRC